MKLLKGLLGSKKFLVALSGVISVVFMETAGIPEETSMKVLGLVIAYVLGQGIADAGKEAVKSDEESKNK